MSKLSKHFECKFCLLRDFMPGHFLFYLISLCKFIVVNQIFDHGNNEIFLKLYKNILNSLLEEFHRT